MLCEYSLCFLGAYNISEIIKATLLTIQELESSESVKDDDLDIAKAYSNLITKIMDFSLVDTSVSSLLFVVYLLLYY